MLFDEDALGRNDNSIKLALLWAKMPIQSLTYWVRSAIIQGMRFSSTACEAISLLGTVTIIQGMPFSTTRAVVILLHTVYNHSSDALLHQSTGYGYSRPRDSFSYQSCSC